MVRCLAKFVTDRSGVAMIEFAYSAPLFLVTVLGGVELINYTLANLRVNQIAMSVADNAGRIQTAVDEANIYELFAGAEVLGRELDFEERGRVVLTSLEDNGQPGGNGGQKIGWQRCWGELPVASRYGVEGDGRDDNSLAGGLGGNGRRIVATPGSPIMFAEVTYRYKPIIGRDLIKDPIIRYESAFNVREHRAPMIGNANDLAVNRCN